MDNKQIKEQIIKAGEKAVLQLIKVAKEDIIKYDADDELAADRPFCAAAKKQIARLVSNPNILGANGEASA